MCSRPIGLMVALVPIAPPPVLLPLPTITCPVSQSVVAAGPRAVTFPAPLTSGGLAPVSTTCEPASGSIFRLGPATVICTARDAAVPARPAQCAFTVTVTQSNPPSADGAQIPPLVQIVDATGGIWMRDASKNARLNSAIVTTLGVQTILWAGGHIYISNYQSPAHWWLYTGHIDTFKYQLPQHLWQYARSTSAAWVDVGTTQPGTSAAPRSPWNWQFPEAFRPCFAAACWISALKTIGAPGSIHFLAACLVVGFVLIYLWPRNRELGHTWLLIIMSGYLVLGLPCVAHIIASRLPGPPPGDSGSWRPLDALIVLDGDNWRGRVREARRVFSVASPRAVLVLSDARLLGPLIEEGIPWARINIENGGTTTEAQLARVRDLLISGHLGRTAIIASRLHMPRVAALALALDLDVLLISSPVDTEPPTSGRWLFVPMYAALQVSRDAIYEHTALAYYRWRASTR